MRTSSGPQSTPHKATDHQQKKKSSEQSLKNLTNRAKQILKLLDEFGPMTGAEISEMIDLGKQDTSAALLRMLKPNAKYPKRIHILRWVTDHHGQRRYPRALYAPGDGPDAKKPKADQNARKREYEARKKMRLKGSFVFNLGIPLVCLRSRSSHGTKTENSVKGALTSKSAKTNTLEAP